jgi:hypothetical protein
MLVRYLTPISLCEIIDFYPHEGLLVSEALVKNAQLLLDTPE